MSEAKATVDPTSLSGCPTLKAKLSELAKIRSEKLILVRKVTCLSLAGKENNFRNSFREQDLARARARCLLSISAQ